METKRMIFAAALGAFAAGAGLVRAEDGPGTFGDLRGWGADPAAVGALETGLRRVKSCGDFGRGPVGRGPALKDYERIETRVLEPERRRRVQADTAKIRQVLYKFSQALSAGPYDNGFGVQTYPACASLSERYRCSRFSWLGGNDGVGPCYGQECGLRY